MDKDDHLILEVLGAINKAREDGNFAPWAKGDEKQKMCRDGYEWNDDKQECVKKEKKKKLEEDGLNPREVHPHGTGEGGPLNVGGKHVTAAYERAEANPSSTSLAVHGGGSTPGTGPKTTWGSGGPGYPGSTTSAANQFNLLNAQDSSWCTKANDDDPYNPHPIKDAIYIEKEEDKNVFYRNGDKLVSVPDGRQLKEWATHYAGKGRGRFSAGKKIYPGEGVNIDL